jgi:DNA-binding MarR family transcriptional regulator
MNQQELSDKTGIDQGNISRILKSIRELSFVPKRVKKVLDVLGWTIEINKNDS